MKNIIGTVKPAKTKFQDTMKSFPFRRCGRVFCRIFYLDFFVSIPIPKMYLNVLKFYLKK